MAGVLTPIVRGAIYWADLNPTRGHEQGGLRPVIILSRTTFNRRSQTVIAMALTSQPQRAGYPFNWKVPAGLLPRESWVKITQIRTLSVDQLGQQIGQLAEHDLAELIDGLLQTIR